MTKIAALLSAGLALALSFSRPAVAADAVCGDVNGNGKVSSSDALAVLRAAVNQPVTLVCPPPSVPAKTGQTICYDKNGATISCSATGEDGELQAGVTRSFTDNGDGTITDNITGLMWEKLVDDGLFHDKDTGWDWQNAFLTKIGKLNSVHFATHSDWRVPNRNELATLVDAGANDPAVFSIFDHDCSQGCVAATCSCTASNEYWTSTSYHDGAEVAWVIEMTDGSVITESKTSTFPIVRAVRDASAK